MVFLLLCIVFLLDLLLHLEIKLIIINMFKYINQSNLENSLKNNSFSFPFSYCVIDNFFEVKTAIHLENEFMEYNNSNWFIYT